MTKQAWFKPVAGVLGALLLVIIMITSSYNGLVDPGLAVDEAVVGADEQRQHEDHRPSDDSEPDPFGVAAGNDGGGHGWSFLTGTRGE